MALEPITRQEKIIAGQDLTPITRMEKFLKQYGGGSGGVTSWNDLTDKPFGEVTTVKEVLAECQPEFLESPADSVSVFMLEDAPLLVVGETYFVNLNGTDYECVVTAVDAGTFAIGNLALAGVGNDTGEPFLIACNISRAVYVIYANDGSTTLTISIRQEVATVQKISGKFVEGMGWSEVTKFHSVTLTWDGVGSADDPSGEVYGILTTYHRVSDDVPSVEQLSAGGIYTLCQNSDFMDTEFTSSDVQDNTSVGFIVVGPVIIACTDNVTAQGLTFPKAGIYFMSMPEEYASGFMVNGYQFETVSETIHPIDQKFLVLTSPNGTQYKLSVADDGTLSAVAAT